MQVKCHEYWPRKLGQKVFVGSGLTVRMDETVPYADYCISKLTLIKQVRQTMPAGIQCPILFLVSDSTPRGACLLC